MLTREEAKRLKELTQAALQATLDHGRRGVHVAFTTEEAVADQRTQALNDYITSLTTPTKTRTTAGDLRRMLPGTAVEQILDSTVPGWNNGTPIDLTFNGITITVEKAS